MVTRVGDVLPLVEVVELCVTSDVRLTMFRWHQEMFLQEAAKLGLTLEPLEPEYGMTFEFESGEAGHRPVHLARMAFNWRLSECDGLLSYRRHWCFPGVGMDTFRIAVTQLLVWRGDPSTEPRGFIKSWDDRTDLPSLSGPPRRPGPPARVLEA